ncbi:MAG: DUF4136 domain-containing protein [Methylomonas sp.]
MFSPLRGCLLAVAIFFLTACSSVSVKTDFDRTATFSQYHTYTLEPSSEQIPLSPSSETALRDTLRNGLARHGVSESGENADLHVVRHISTKEKLQVYPSASPMPYRYGMWAGAPYTDVSQYTEGTLILDFVDAKTHKLVFRGIGTGTVSDPETNAARIREAVEEIVQQYPSGASQ